MAKVSFTQENMPASSEEFRALLDEAIEKSNPIDDLLELVEDMAVFEKKYQMPSAEFYRKFQAGQMGDDFEFFEWSAMYRMYTGTRRAIELALMRDAVRLNGGAAREMEVSVEQEVAVPA
ncbi:MAG: hypothetical protein KBG20_21130 [Caldilineaceae bacterium]|nr:hypothetical protein [Caldilineaceae bacterium]MBP8108545.1 hypothetical protein [Caldilineaceae bacterium]MBP8123519.1 hypothetical protein [Caldilineaceae bacterium]MBP9074824.1 hypothetical protein [Caldilineaceae bacterium]